jgi:exportin-7
MFQSEHFPFLGFTSQNTIKDMRCRTIFYTALGRLLNLDLSDEDDNFEQFMMPLSSKHILLFYCLFEVL